MSDNREMIILNGEQIDELVRCQDCKYFMPKTNACAMASLMCPDENDFCSRGVRR